MICWECKQDKGPADLKTWARLTAPTKCMDCLRAGAAKHTPSPGQEADERIVRKSMERAAKPKKPARQKRPKKIRQTRRKRDNGKITAIDVSDTAKQFLEELVRGRPELSVKLELGELETDTRGEMAPAYFFDYRIGNKAGGGGNERSEREAINKLYEAVEHVIEPMAEAHNDKVAKRIKEPEAVPEPVFNTDDERDEAITAHELYWAAMSPAERQEYSKAMEPGYTGVECSYCGEHRHPGDVNHTGEGAQCITCSRRPPAPEPEPIPPDWSRPNPYKRRRRPSRHEIAHAPGQARLL